MARILTERERPGGPGVLQIMARSIPEMAGQLRCLAAQFRNSALQTEQFLYRLMMSAAASDLESEADRLERSRQPQALRAR